ncbi:MAG: hypothetical protein A2987_00425 [Omnitrophica bacterium RIFCSPLOWO2_01_FULL_45_10]|nr:MAG: hypothetical protein A2987_00425 [Omnitrophica bacterium RIFCSPLOWO2_01_FULL_45_10]
MGIDRGSIKLLMREGKRERYSGYALTLGRQDVLMVTAQNLQRWAKEMDFQLKPIPIALSMDRKFINNDYITDVGLFSSIGFNNIDSLDYSDFEQCTITHDLNKDVPAKLHNKYDLIFDGGTSEHIFNLPKVLENYNKMLKVGGRTIHFLPSTNCVEHGFYMFSPTLFWSYYSANNWDIKDSLFVKYSQHGHNYLMDVYQYTPGCMDRLSYGGLNKGIYYVFFVVKKTDISTYGASVQQGQYLERWKSASAARDVRSKTDNPLKKIAAMLPGRLRAVLYLLYRFMVLKIPLKVHLKFIGRY